MFHALTEHDLAAIVDLLLADLARRLAEQDITLELTPAARALHRPRGHRSRVRGAAAQADHPAAGREPARARAGGRRVPAGRPDRGRRRPGQRHARVRDGVDDGRDRGDAEARRADATHGAGRPGARWRPAELALGPRRRVGPRLTRASGAATGTAARGPRVSSGDDALHRRRCAPGGHAGTAAGAGRDPHAGAHRGRRPAPAADAAARSPGSARGRPRPRLPRRVGPGPRRADRASQPRRVPQRRGQLPGWQGRTRGPRPRRDGTARSDRGDRPRPGRGRSAAAGPPRTVLDPGQRLPGDPDRRPSHPSGRPWSPHRRRSHGSSSRP